MPTRDPLVEGEIYHIYNRGIDGKVIFPSDEYYERFVLGLELFNTTESVQIREINTEVKPQGSGGEKLVEIGVFNLRPTHYHLLLRQLVPDGISLLMQKLGTGFTMFYNLKNSRSGSLFQGTFKAKLIDADRYLKHIFAYIALNSLDKDMSEWRDGGITDLKKAEHLLMNDRWSSFGSLFTENRRFKSIISKDFVEEFFDNVDELKEFVLSWSGAEVEVINGLLSSS